MELHFGLVIMTRDESGKLVAVPKRCDEFNWKDGCPVPYPGSRRFTVQGQIRLEERENREAALYRAATEELGSNFTGTPLAWHTTIANIAKVGETETPEKVTVYYAIEVPLERLADIWPDGGPRPIRQADLANIRPLEDPFFVQEEGVTCSKVLAMPKDEIEALKRAFTTFGNLPGAQPEEDEAPLKHHVHAWADSQLFWPS